MRTSSIGSAGALRQPNPALNTNKPVAVLVIRDLIHRLEHGMETYGTPLQAFNGRNALVDGLQELEDGLLYFSQAIEEAGDEKRRRGLVLVYEALLELTLEVRQLVK